jgi:hypothetical protein
VIFAAASWAGKTGEMSAQTCLPDGFMRGIWLTAFLLLLFMLAGCGSGSPQLPKLAAADVIVAFGDSLTHGTGAAEHESYPAVLSQLINRQVVRAGVPQPALVTSAPEFYAELAKEFALPYEGKVVTSVLYSPELKSDPIHPNAKGYRRMAEALAELLRKSGAI